MISDIVHMITILNMGIPGRTDIGGAGAVDVVIIAGLVGIMFAELVGEIPGEAAKAARRSLGRTGLKVFI